MADQFGLFWNSINSDRTYDADSFAEWLRKFFTTGIFNGEMQVTPGTGMQVNVAPGYANLNGKVRFFDTAQTFTLDPASGTYPRIDTIVVRADSTNRIITTEYVKGAYSGASPVPTAPVRTGGIYEIVLAQIRIGAGITAIMAQDITDTRPNDNLCGWVTSTVEGVPMDQITTQMQADFLAWYDRMKGQLSEDAAGNLQLQIDNLNDDLESNVNRLDGKINTTELKANGVLRALNGFIEHSPATAQHSKGELFVVYLNGAYWFVEATQNISVGQTIAFNSNITGTSVIYEFYRANDRINNLIQTRVFSGTTDGAGNISGGSTTTQILLSAVPDRRENANVSGVQIITTGAGTAYLLHCVQSNGAPVANQYVSVICTYVDGSLI